MKALLSILTAALTAAALAGCDNRPQVPRLDLTSVDGTSIELNDSTPLTAVYFFSVSNPVALGALYRLHEELDDAADSVAIALNVDRPPNVEHMRQDTLVPIVIDEAGRFATAFGGIDLTPTLILIDKGSVLLQQRARLDYEEINTIISRYK